MIRKLSKSNNTLLRIELLISLFFFISSLYLVFNRSLNTNSIKSGDVNDPPRIDPPDIVDGKLYVTAYDDDPASYAVTLNGILVASGSWESGVLIIIDISSLNAGSHTITITFTDQEGHSVSDSIVVTIYFKIGDVDHGGVVDIIDALLIARYYIGLDPQPFYPEEADVDSSGTIDIVDALLVAQAYIGLIELPP